VRRCKRFVPYWKRRLPPINLDFIAPQRASEITEKSTNSKKEPWVQIHFSKYFFFVSLCTQPSQWSPWLCGDDKFKMIGGQKETLNLKINLTNYELNHNRVEINLFMNPAIMTLYISRKYHEFEAPFWNEHVPAFDPVKGKLTARRVGEHGSLITDWEEITRRIAALQPPTYTSCATFYNCFKNIEHINGLAKASGTIKLIDTLPWQRSLKPSAEELKDKLWAVHVSDYLWPDAILKPFQKRLGSLKPAHNVSLTVHFSLGEMVRSHSEIYTWKYRNFAVLTPLSELVQQMVGIYPYDTFIHGEWKITKKAIVLVPENTTLPEVYLTEGSRVVTYDVNKTTLRKAIKHQINSEGGITLTMVRNLLLPGAPAYLYGHRELNINSMNFFENFLNEYPKLSFGPDTISLNNRNGYCFGLIRQITAHLMTNTDEDCLSVLYVYFNYVCNKIYELLKLEERIKIDEILEKYRPYLCASSRYKQVSKKYIFRASSDFVGNLNFKCLLKFRASYPQLFDSSIDDVVIASWALKRWLWVGEKQAAEEGLETYYKLYMSFNLKQKTICFNSEIIDCLKQQLEGQSERVNLARYILNLPETRAYNSSIVMQSISKHGCDSKLQFFYDNYSIDSIPELLAAYTETSEFFEDNYLLPTVEILGKYIEGNTCSIFSENAKEKLELFSKLFLFKAEWNISILRSSFANIRHAMRFIPSHLTKDELYSTSIQNLSSLPDSILMLWKIYGIHHLWNKLGLEKQFRAVFPIEAVFWNESKTFVDIYRSLKKI
jgi:hypothetical protein